MCPACIGSALIAFTGAGSAGGLFLVASKAFGKRRRNSAGGADSATHVAPGMAESDMNRIPGEHTRSAADGTR